MKHLSIQEKADNLTLDKLVKIDKLENHRLKECMKILHSYLFPVEYQPAFFEMIYENNYHGMNLHCLFNGILVGAICARLEADKGGEAERGTQTHLSSSAAQSEADKLAGTLDALTLKESSQSTLHSNNPEILSFRCYIMTLGVLPQYRRLGIASKLLQKSMDNLKAFVRRKNEAIQAQAANAKKGEVHQPVKIQISEIALHVQVNNQAAIDFYTKHGFSVKERAVNYYTAIEPRDAFVLTKNVAADELAVAV